MSEKSDDPRDAVAIRETQRSDQDERRAQRKREDKQPAEVRTVDDDIIREDGGTEHAGYSGGNGTKNG
jgi:hypothetical protein